MSSAGTATPVASQIPPLVLGSMTFGDTADTAEAARIIQHAVDAGITWVDTANVYAGGRSEEILGELLRNHDDMVVATKVGMPTPDAPDLPPLSPPAIRQSLEASLRRLRRDHIELLYLHLPDRKTPIRDTLSVVSELVAEGKVGALGISNYAAWQVADLIRVADEIGAPRPVVGQQLYNMLASRLDEEYAEFAATAGLPTMVYTPLAGGLLTGRHTFETRASQGRFGDASNAQLYRKRYWDQQLFQAVDRLTEIATAAGIPLAEMALRWTISRPVTRSVLLGASRLEQFAANVDALRNGPLDADVLAAIEEVGGALRGPMPAYNR